MIMPDPNVIGYVPEHASQTVDGGFRVDAAPLGYAGLKTDCITNDLGELIGEFYRGCRSRVRHRRVSDCCVGGSLRCF
jgi:hypothetical protein